MKLLRLLPVLLLVSALVQAQKIHIGVFGGVSAYNGDLVDKIFPANGATNAAFGATLTYEYNDHINIRAGYNYGKVGGNDKFSKSEELLKRNLSFETDIHDFTLVGEYNVFSLYERRYTPYFFAGIGAYHFNPYAYDRSGLKTYLQPLGTEGQGISGYAQKPYNLTQVSIPLGIGFRFAITDNIRLGIEGSYRKLFTDHLDDLSGSYADEGDLFAARGATAVDMAYRGDETPLGSPAYPVKGAQRGNSKNKDSYYFTGVHLMFRLGSVGEGSGRRSGRRSGMGCPANML
jgi:hypothetical protein